MGECAPCVSSCAVRSSANSRSFSARASLIHAAPAGKGERGRGAWKLKQLDFSRNISWRRMGCYARGGVSAEARRGSFWRVGKCLAGWTTQRDAPMSFATRSARSDASAAAASAASARSTPSSASFTAAAAMLLCLSASVEAGPRRWSGEQRRASARGIRPFGRCRSEMEKRLGSQG